MLTGGFVLLWNLRTITHNQMKRGKTMAKTVNTQEVQETQANTQNISTAITKAVNDVYSENPFAVVETRENTAEIRTTTTDNTAKTVE